MEILALDIPPSTGADVAISSRGLKMLFALLSPDHPFPNFCDWSRLSEVEQLQVLAFGLRRAILAGLEVTAMSGNKVWVRGILTSLRVMVTMRQICSWSTLLAPGGQLIKDMVEDSFIPWITSLVAQVVWKSGTAYPARRQLYPCLQDSRKSDRAKELCKDTWRLVVAWEGFLDSKRVQWLPYEEVILAFLFCDEN